MLLGVFQHCHGHGHSFMFVVITVQQIPGPPIKHPSLSIGKDLSFCMQHLTGGRNEVQDTQVVLEEMVLLAIPSHFPAKTEFVSLPKAESLQF